MGEIRLDTRGGSLLRIVPRTSSLTVSGEHWLSDHSRFAPEGLNRNRLATPLFLTSRPVLNSYSTPVNPQPSRRKRTWGSLRRDLVKATTFPSVSSRY